MSTPRPDATPDFVVILALSLVCWTLTISTTRRTSWGAIWSPVTSPVYSFSRGVSNHLYASHGGMAAFMPLSSSTSRGSGKRAVSAIPDPPEHRRHGHDDDG